MSAAGGRPRAVLWSVVVAAFVLAAASVSVLAQSPRGGGVLLGGLLATFLIVRMRVVLTRPGSAPESLDLAEAPAVALGLLLPPGQALLVFGAAACLGGLSQDIAGVKRLFNASVTVAGGGCVVGAVAAADALGASPSLRMLAAAVGALTYAALSHIAVSTMIASLQRSPLRLSVGAPAVGDRLLVLAAAIAIGLAVAVLVDERPLAAVGVVAPLALLALTTRSSLAAQRDRERLEQVLFLTNVLQDATTPLERDDALVAAGRVLFGGRDVEVRPGPSTDGEAGRELNGDGRSRWLVTAPGRTSDPWRPEDGRVLDALAVVANQALQRASLRQRLAEQALRDPLTGIANRRAVTEHLDALLESSPAVGVLLIDLNDFKVVNDRLGHDVGDAVLCTVAARLGALAVRAGELAGRLGGDEFVVVLPTTGPGTVRELAERVRAHLKEPMDVAGYAAAVGGSVGVAVSPDDGTTRAELLAAADRRMYEDKQSDRRLRVPAPPRVQ